MHFLHHLLPLSHFVSRFESPHAAAPMYRHSLLKSGHPPCEELRMPYIIPSESQMLSFRDSIPSEPR